MNVEVLNNTPLMKKVVQESKYDVLFEQMCKLIQAFDERHKQISTETFILAPQGCSVIDSKGKVIYDNKPCEHQTSFDL